MRESILPAQQFSDSRGSMCVLEGEKLPFQVQRVYYLFDVPVGAVRGEHGHKRLEQLFVCMSGAVEMTIHNGISESVILLSNPNQTVYLPAGMWRSLRFLEKSTIVVVLASANYDMADYIYDFNEFLAWARTEKN